MNAIVLCVTVVIAVVVTGGPAWKDTTVQRGGGLKIGQGGAKNASSARGNGLRLGTSTRTSRTTTSTFPPDFDEVIDLDEEEADDIRTSVQIPTPPSTDIDATNGNGGDTDAIRQLHVGMVVPYKSFGVREYTKAATSAKYVLQRKLTTLFKRHDMQVHTVMQELTPSPTESRSGQGYFLEEKSRPDHVYLSFKDGRAFSAHPLKKK